MVKKQNYYMELPILARASASPFRLGLSAQFAILLAGVSSFSLVSASAMAADDSSQPAGEVKTFTVSSNLVPMTASITDDGNQPVSIVKDGEGTLVLASENTYTGSTIIKQGEILLGVEGSLPNSSGVVLNGSGSFDISLAASPINIKSLSGNPASGTVSLGANTLNITSAGVNDLLYANISGKGGTLNCKWY